MKRFAGLLTALILCFALSPALAQGADAPIDQAEMDIRHGYVEDGQSALRSQAQAEDGTAEMLLCLDESGYVLSAKEKYTLTDPEAAQALVQSWDIGQDGTWSAEDRYAYFIWSREAVAQGFGPLLPSEVSLLMGVAPPEDAPAGQLLLDDPDAAVSLLEISKDGSRATVRFHKKPEAQWDMALADPVFDGSGTDGLGIHIIMEPGETAEFVLTGADVKERFGRSAFTDVDLYVSFSANKGVIAGPHKLTLRDSGAETDALFGMDSGEADVDIRYITLRYEGMRPGFVHGRDALAFSCENKSKSVLALYTRTGGVTLEDGTSLDVEIYGKLSYPGTRTTLLLAVNEGEDLSAFTTATLRLTLGQLKRPQPEWLYTTRALTLDLGKMAEEQAQ